LEPYVSLFFFNLFSSCRFNSSFSSSVFFFYSRCLWNWSIIVFFLSFSLNAVSFFRNSNIARSLSSCSFLATSSCFFGSFAFLYSPSSAIFL